MARFSSGWPFITASVTYRVRKHRGVIIGVTIRAVPILPRRHDVPMSAREALAIVQAIQPGALHRLHRRGIPDPIALRALEVAGMV